jgi:membrane-associated phospholipid phosphatase
MVVNEWNFRMYLCLSLLVIFPGLIQAQTQVSDSVDFSKTYPYTEEGVRFSAKQLIIPGVLITAGIYSRLDKQLDKHIRNQAVKWNGNTFWDDIFPVAIPASAYILNWSGIQGKHKFVDRTVILGTAFVLTAGTSYLLKATINTSRPDGNGNDAFPSRHTAITFSGAEFLRQEFKDESVWYGVAGYTFATLTGFLRIYNNRHWFSDVIAGAGIGILGTRAAYWLYPKLRKLYAGSRVEQATIVPFGNEQGLGVGVWVRF